MTHESLLNARFSSNKCRSEGTIVKDISRNERVVDVRITGVDFAAFHAEDHVDEFDRAEHVLDMVELYRKSV